MDVDIPPWVQGALFIVLVIVLLAPVFNWAAGEVGYAEPLENAADKTGAHDDAFSIVDGVFPDYSVSGLGPNSGTLVAAFVGTALTLIVTWKGGRVLAE